MKLKKIKVKKGDEPTAVAEAVLDIEEDVIVLVIPKLSRFAESKSNFKLIKKQADILNKQIIIESVDEDIIEYAQEVGLESRNPFMEERKKRFADIVGPTKKSYVPEDEREEEAEYIEEVKEVKISKNPLFKLRGEPVRDKINRLSKKKIVIAISTLILLVLIYVAVTILPRASANLITTKHNYIFDSLVSVRTDAPQIDIEERIIPGQLFIKSKTMSFSFEANDERFVERKATGEVTIYNEYSSKSQELVVNTRFMTPSGKIYKITKAVTIPGATLKDGKIIRSSITVPVAADQPGPEYNTDPVTKLTIPGFANTAQAEGFYGEFKQSVDGGFIGTTKVPNEADIEKGKQESLVAIRELLETELAQQVPEGFIQLPSAKKFTLLKQSVDTSTNQEGKFTILVEAEINLLGFKHESIEDLVTKTYELENEDSNLKVISGEPVYKEEGAINPKSGAMSILVKLDSVLAKNIIVDTVKAQMAGQSEAGLKNIIFSMPGIENANISLWPFWVRTVPNKLNKITINIE